MSLQRPREVAAFAVVLLSLFGPGCGSAAINIRDVTFTPYRAEDRGKFFTVCFDRPLERRESYDFEMRIATKTGRELSCNGIFADDALDATPQSCYRSNAFLCLKRSSPARDLETVRDHIGAGAVQSVSVTLFSTVGQRRSIGQWSFGAR